MRISSKTILFIVLIAGMLASCNGSTTMPVEPQATDSGTAVPTSLPPSPLPPTAPATPVMGQIVYYYLVSLTGDALPEGSVIIMPDTYILAPQLSESAYSPEPAADLHTALDYALHDFRNGWKSADLDIVDVAYGDGHTDIVLQGEYFGVGSVTLIAARMQLLFTIFANPAVQSATVTLNGDTIGNLGVSNSMYAFPVDYAFTRAEIEAYQAENQATSP